MSKGLKGAPLRNGPGFSFARRFKPHGRVGWRRSRRFAKHPFFYDQFQNRIIVETSLAGLAEHRLGAAGWQGASLPRSCRSDPSISIQAGPTCRNALPKGEDNENEIGKKRQARMDYWSLERIPPELNRRRDSQGVVDLGF